MDVFHISRRVAILAAVAGVVGMGAVDAMAQSYPTKAVVMVVPFSPGGTADVVARLLAQEMKDALKQSFIVENKAGATGAIAATYVAKSAPDGYRLLVGTASVNTVNPAYKRDVGFDPLRDFAPVVLFANFPNMLVVNPSVPAKTVPELIKLLKASPNKYNFGSSGVGSSLHLSAELFKLLSGTKMTHIPYKGSAPALNDLLAGRIQMTFDNMTTVWPLVQQGRLRALGVTTKARVPQAPDVPSISETLPEYDAASWVGLLAPAKTPKAIVDALAGAVDRALKKPDISKKLVDLGAAVGGGTPAEFSAFVKADLARWQDVVRKAGVGGK